MTKPFRKDNLEVGDPSQYLSPEQLQPFDKLRERIEKGERLIGDDLQEYQELEEILLWKHHRAVSDFEVDNIIAQHPVAKYYEEVIADLNPARGEATHGIKAWFHKKANRDGLHMLLLCDRDNVLQFEPHDEVRVGGRRFRISDAKRECQDYAEKIGPHHDILLKASSDEEEETKTYGEGSAPEPKH